MIRPPAIAHAGGFVWVVERSFLTSWGNLVPRAFLRRGEGAQEKDVVKKLKQATISIPWVYAAFNMTGGLKVENILDTKLR